MLTRLLHKAVFTAWRSLRSPTYSRPEQIDWLRLKFIGNKRYAEKFEYLNKLQAEGRLSDFYKDKPMEQLQDQELYFLMNSNTSFTVTKKGQLDLMAKLRSTYFKCLLLKEFRWIGQIEQYLIIFSFNEEVFDMQPYEIEFCLEIISDFTVPKNQIDVNNLEKALLKHVELTEFAHSILLICGYVDDMDIKFKKIKMNELLEKCIKNNDNWDFRAIYYTYRLSQRLQFKIQQGLKKQLDQYMSKAILKLQMSYFQSNYLVFLLSYYPQYLDLLNILYFTPRAYNGYLRFYRSNPQLKIQKHKIPISVIQLTPNFILRQIIQLRVILELENPLSLVQSLDDFFVYSIIPVYGVFQYLVEQKVRDLQIQFIFEKKVEEKLQLKQFNPQILEEYLLKSVLNFFSKLARQQWFSVDFWKKVVRWIDQLLRYHSQHGVIDNKLETCINLMHIVNIKNVREQTRQAVYKFAKQLLEKPQVQYSPMDLHSMAKALANGRIGEGELWILIQHRLNQLFQNKKNKQQQFRYPEMQVLGKIVLQFSIMSKGSYYIWSMFNQILNNQIKRELLNKIKDLNNSAHIYLKLTEQTH